MVSMTLEYVCTDKHVLCKIILNQLSMIDKLEYSMSTL